MSCLPVTIYNTTFNLYQQEEEEKNDSIQSDINYAELSSRNCHAGFSGILLQERFPTSGNENYAAIVMTLSLIWWLIDQ